MKAVKTEKPILLHLGFKRTAFSTKVRRNLLKSSTKFFSIKPMQSVQNARSIKPKK